MKQRVQDLSLSLSLWQLQFILRGERDTPATAKTSSLACDLVPTNDKDSRFLSEIKIEHEPPRKLVSGSWYSGRSAYRSKEKKAEPSRQGHDSRMYVSEDSKGISLARRSYWE